MNCSRCHDHKFDPITQKEYYQLYDYFNQTSEDGKIHGGQAPPLLEMGTPLQQTKLEELIAYTKELGAKVAQSELSIFPRPEGQPASSF